MNNPLKRITILRLWQAVDTKSRKSSGINDRRLIRIKTERDRVLLIMCRQQYTRDVPLCPIF